ncbi:hypothetical protein P0W76_17190, partial [Tsukamurella sp. 8J]|nr:hypothetical protein [Tsukamurella sp. 8J]
RRRTLLLTELDTILDLAAHDAFVSDHPDGLGTRAAWIYATLPADPTPRDDLHYPGLPASELDTTLTALHAAGLVDVTSAGIARADPAARDAYAAVAGTAGILDARAAQYALERALWAWWLAELEAMHTPRSRSGGRDQRRPRPGQLLIDTPSTPAWASAPAYPRTYGGRGDHRAARRALADAAAEAA